MRMSVSKSLEQSQRDRLLQYGKHTRVEVRISLEKLLLANRRMPVFFLSGLDVIVVEDGHKVVLLVAAQSQRSIPSFYLHLRISHSLSARVGNETLLVSHQELHPSIVAFSPELGHRIRLDIRGRDEEAEAKVVMALRHRRVGVADDSFHANRVYAVSGNDNISGDDLAGDQRY